MIWQVYQPPLQLDGMIVRGNTVNAAVNWANKIAEMTVRGDHEGAKTEEELQQRMKSRRRGIELGAKIYQEVFNIAIQRGLSTTWRS